MADILSLARRIIESPVNLLSQAREYSTEIRSMRLRARARLKRFIDLKTKAETEGDDETVQLLSELIKREHGLTHRESTAFSKAMANETKICLLGLLAKKVGPITHLSEIHVLRHLSEDPLVEDVIRDIADRTACAMISYEEEFRLNAAIECFSSALVENSDREFYSITEAVLSVVYRTLQVKHHEDEKSD